MRLKIRLDWTGEPPGEFTITATLGTFDKLKALSRPLATEPIVRPGRSGVARPIGPEKRTTGTTGRRLKNRIISLLLSAPEQPDFAGIRRTGAAGPARTFTQPEEHRLAITRAAMRHRSLGSRRFRAGTDCLHRAK